MKRKNGKKRPQSKTRQNHPAPSQQEKGIGELVEQNKGKITLAGLLLRLLGWLWEHRNLFFTY